MLGTDHLFVCSNFRLLCVFGIAKCAPIAGLPSL
jgi:hypothetical protein